MAEAAFLSRNAKVMEYFKYLHYSIPLSTALFGGKLEVPPRYPGPHFKQGNNFELEKAN